MYVGDIQSKLKNRLKQHLYINIVIKQHSSNSSGMQRYYKIIIYPRCYVILMKLYSQYISSIIPLWLKNTLCWSYAESGQPQCWCEGHACSRAGTSDAQRSAQPTSAVICLQRAFFACTNPILPFSYAPNLGDRAWKHLFVSSLHQDLPVARAGQQQSPTPQVTSGEELGTVSVSWQKFTISCSDIPLPLMSVSWRLVSIGKNSRLAAVSVPFLASPCSLFRDLQSQGFLLYKTFATACW